MTLQIDRSAQETAGRGRMQRAFFWIAGSALLGSVALALWNRRTLSEMRDAIENPPPSPQLRDDDGIY
jgi:hypothetical protein